MAILPFPISGSNRLAGAAIMVGRFPVPYVGPALRCACGNPGTPSLYSGWPTIILRAAQHEHRDKILEYARECARRAELVTDPELRERLFNISRRWTERATREPYSGESQRNRPEHPT